MHGAQYQGQEPGRFATGAERDRIDFGDPLSIKRYESDADRQAADGGQREERRGDFHRLWRHSLWRSVDRLLAQMTAV
ncbi:MAG: hypothetical protein MI785_03680 [Kiloniellales bacterium]|nr:hypothetical protein [Kiloniellales bacterium]